MSTGLRGSVYVYKYYNIINNNKSLNRTSMYNVYAFETHVNVKSRMCKNVSGQYV